MQKKVLIYMPENLLAPVGGPRGYLYNLKCELDRRGIKNISFLPAKKVGSPFHIKILNRVWNSVQLVLNQFKILYGKCHRSEIDLSRFDVIHFHDTWSMFSVKDSLSSYQGTVVLTSHSPTLLSKEWHDEANGMKKFLFGRMLRDLIRIDEYSFNRADKILFPCEEAEEPYLNAWPAFECLKRNNRNKFIYNPTGIIGKEAKTENTKIRKDLNIPENAVVFNFAGRHNSIKGYDYLQDIAIEVLDKFPNVYFLIEGIETPLKGLKHPRWIEIGWTKDPHSYINASDAFILPNRETYFDLIMLEVLSLGKIVITTETGGNKYFKQYEGSGIILCRDRKALIQAIERVVNMGCSERTELESINKKLFEENFTIGRFTDRYLDIIDTL